MMNALEQARNHIETALGMDAEMAQAYAAIAQAEQLKRIADALERFVDTYGVTAEVYEAAERGLRVQAMDDEIYRLNQRIAHLQTESRLLRQHIMAIDPEQFTEEEAEDEQY